MPKASPAQSEWLTRKTLIDGKLKDAGWRVVPFSAAKTLVLYDKCAVEEYPTQTGPADYVLILNSKIVGVVEAKKLTLGPQNVLSQAERYSKGLHQVGFEFGSFGVPFLYATNDEVIWFHDVRHQLNRSRPVTRFHTPDAIEEMLDRDLDACFASLDVLPNDNPKLRPYQLDSNQKTEEAIEARKRAMLIAMATGTGKTFTLVNEIYRLMKSGTAKRVLFLVDRRALAAQAVRALGSFEAEPGLKFDKIYEIYSQKFQAGDCPRGTPPSDVR